MNAEIERNFFKFPIREMPLAYLSDWYFAAFDDLTHDIAAYLLPRIFELIAEGNWPNRISDEVTLRCLSATGYPQSWTPQERDAVEAFLTAMLDESLSERRFWDGPSLDCFLCMVCTANADIGALLDRIDNADEKWVARALASDLEGIGLINSSGRLVNAFWDGVDAELQLRVKAWYCRPALCGSVEQAFFTEVDPEWQRRLSNAVEIMRTWG